ncbi:MULTISPECIES: hypothetical protein [Polaromonas]|uniref:Uncharacterized protein n=1 Tax=Polaromonas aquatica TaxID=332657 RepID=A0ABW1TQL2_9BURK
MNSVSPELYRAHMIEAKHRLVAIDRILGAKKPRTLSVSLDDEFCWLQLRQIVELVAFSAVAADEERYAALRREAKSNPDYRVDSKPAKVLLNLSQISPHFLPKSLGNMVLQPDGTKHFVQGPEIANLERFLEIHDTAGQHLHATNPFSESEGVAKKLRLAGARQRIRLESDYLKGVLWNHVKVGLLFEADSSPRIQDNPDHAWIVSFGNPMDESIEMKLARGILPAQSVDTATTPKA